jgi:hypothetical protein
MGVRKVASRVNQRREKKIKGEGDALMVQFRMGILTDHQTCEMKIRMSKVICILSSSSVGRTWYCREY